MGTYPCSLGAQAVPIGLPIGEIWNIQLSVPPRSLWSSITPLYNHVYNLQTGEIQGENNET